MKESTIKMISGAVGAAALIGLLASPKDVNGTCSAEETPAPPPAAAESLKYMPPRHIAVTVEPTAGEKRRMRFYRLPSFLKALLTLPVMLLGEALLFLLRRVTAAAAPAVQLTFLLLLRVLLWVGLFVLVLRLIYPGRPAGTFIRQHLYTLLFAAAAMTAADALLVTPRERALLVRLLVTVPLTALTLFLVYRRLFRAAPPPKQTMKWIELDGSAQ